MNTKKYNPPAIQMKMIIGIATHAVKTRRVRLLIEV